MQDFQLRVITEKAELMDKIDKLETFIKNSIFIELDKIDQHLLGLQLHIMKAYFSTLKARVANFKTGK